LSLSSLLSHWRSEPSIGGNVVAWHALPARSASFSELPEDILPGLKAALSYLGITRLFSHQFEAWDCASEGKNIAIVTGTASGKTLCYNLPVLEHLLRDPKARALYLFPTKALSQDQLVTIREMVANLDNESNLQSDFDFNLEIAVYDGDTPSSYRRSIREKARLVISNPDMLHTGILPHHTSWTTLFNNLHFVIIDEMHSYRGVFGSHVANVLRRLRRIAAFYGSFPKFILTSATIANPQELAELFVEAPVSVIDNDGSARGLQHFLLYNPPIVDKDLGLRRSVLQESVRLVEDLLAFGIQTIIFGRTRRTVELILIYLREKLEHQSWDRSLSEDSIRGYRSGYLPSLRRQIERGLLQGDVRAVVATSALELGIDIGGMGAAVITGYPGTIAGTWQQAGRAGRGESESLAMLIASASPIDQFLARNPDYFFSRSVERALINPDNLLILLAHLRCAAFELPFREGESFGSVNPLLLSQFLGYLQKEGTVYQSGEKYFWMADTNPAQGISLRSASADRIVLQVAQGEDSHTIGEVDKPSATWMVHPGAIYLHEAQTYFVDDLDMDRSHALLHPISAEYYTEPISERTVQLVELFAEENVPGGVKSQGEIQVTTQVKSFRKIRWHTHEHLGTGDVDLPPTDLFTTGYWIALSESTVERLRDEGLWSIDSIDYGPEWESIRDLVRARDNYICQMCGTPEVVRTHHIHHKIPFRMFGSPEQANQLSNLITLCPSCHRRIEVSVRIRSGLSGMAFALENMAPLFLMCDTRDLGVHSDPQSGLSDGRPVVLIYDQVPAGIGFSERLFELHDELISSTHELVATCECSDGCPSCVGPGGDLGAGGKHETLAIMGELLLNS
jgi:DEAD/DEAH box helicase domain-containing protein